MRRSSRRVWAARLLLVVGTFTLSLLGLEVLVRSVPSLLPKGAFYGSGTHDSELGFRVARTPVVYNKVRHVVRTPNTDGFLDIDHDESNDFGAARLAVIGDSYVEAVQVPLEKTFFRLLQDRLGDAAEVFALGQSGLGTLHARSIYRKFRDQYDFDYVIYFFVNNDPGDHFRPVQRRRRGVYLQRPTATAHDEEPGYRIHLADEESVSPVVGVARALKDASWLVRAVYAQVQAAQQNSKEESSQNPGFRSWLHPGGWEPQLRAEAGDVTRAILRDWFDEMQADGVIARVFYVPNEAELHGDDDSWRSWLLETCRELGIDVVDPTEEFIRRQVDEGPLYEDHWSLAGHRLVAELLAAELKQQLGQASTSGAGANARLSPESSAP